MKYSIVMPYHHRPVQLYNTLISFDHWYKGRNDYEVIIVEDNKNHTNVSFHKSLIEVVSHFDNIKIIKTSSNTINPSIHFNIGVKHSIGEYIVITNPECFHKTNILGGFDKSISNNTYIVCACISSSQRPIKINSFKGFSYTFSNWYQHSKHNNKRLHWCSCISKERYNKIGGFDERYKDGICHEDIDFIHTIHYNTDMDIICDDNLLVIHQYHERCYNTGNIDPLLNASLRREKWLGKK